MFGFIALLGGGITISLIFFSTLRIFGTSYFDVFALVYSLFMAFTHKNLRRYFLLLEYPIWVGVLMSVSFILSAAVAEKPSEHATKCVSILFDYFNMIIFAYIIATSGYFSKRNVYAILCISGTISSIVCILQGQFGVFTSLITYNPDSSSVIDYYGRYTGLAEHPVEAGIISAYTGVLALANMLDAINKFSKVFWGLGLAVTSYSMIFSASFTGILSCTCASCLILLVRRAWLSLGMILAGATLLTPLIANPDFVVGSLLQQRVQDLLTNGQKFETVQSRSSQVSVALEMMGNNPLSLLFGFGYRDVTSQKLSGLDIHNSLVGAYFHFGFICLIANIALIIYFLRSTLFDQPKRERSIAVAIFIIFMSGYLTGPLILRRSIWMIPIFCALLTRAQSCGINEKKETPKQISPQIAALPLP